MTVSFKVRKLEDLPPDKTDKYADVVVAFKNLRGDEALMVDGETSDGRALQGIAWGIKASLKRAAITAVQIRVDAEERGVWVWRKPVSEPKNNGSSPEASFDAARPRVPGAGAATGR